MNVIVIGAGLAGLAAAGRLQSAGHEVCVLERSARAGGRIGADVREDFRLPRTLECIHAGDHATLEWIRSLGLAGDMLPLRPLQILQVFEGTASPIDPQSMGGVATIPGVRFRDAARLLRWSRLMTRYAPLLDPAAPEKAASLDFRSVRDFARLYFGSSVYDRWIEPETRDAFGSDGAELSRVATLLTWCARATGHSTSVVHGLPRRPFAVLADRAAEGIEIRLDLEAMQIDQVSSGEFRVSCQASKGGQGELNADAVLIATSAEEAHRLMGRLKTPAERDYFESLRTESELILSLGLSAPPTGLPQRIRFPQSESSPFDCVVLEPGSSNGRAPQGRGLAVIRAAEHFTQTHASTADDVVEKGLISGLERFLPQAAVGIEHAVLHRTTGSRTRFDVGAYRALAQFRKVQEDRRAQGRRVYYAGDYLIGPGVEAAVVSAVRASDDLLADATVD